jgi:HK97 family phage prohead protease
MSDSDRAAVHREFAVDLTEGDGRTIDMRVVPYNAVARVADPPDFEPYDEVWRPGAFDNQVKAANRVSVFLNFEHQQGLPGLVGHGVALRDNDEGLDATFRVHENSDGDKALHLVREGILHGASIEAIPLRSATRGGVTERLRGHLRAVALCREPAYKEAQVLAVRTEPLPEPEPLADEMVERLARLGIEPVPFRNVVHRVWDAAADRFEDDEYARACLVDRGGDGPVKERCAVPVLEPNGDLNVNALPAAASAVSALPLSLRGQAARKLIRYYRQASLTPPPSLQVHATRN